MRSAFSDRSVGEGSASAGLSVQAGIQPSLFDEREPAEDPRDRASIDRAFRLFHLRHPEVYDAVCRLARQAKDNGKTTIGIGMLWEVLRWETSLAGGDTDESYRLNNNYRSRYARLVMERESDLDGIFNLRELQTR